MPATPTSRKPVTTLDVSTLSPTQFSRSPRTPTVAASPKVKQVHTRLIAIARRLVENYSTWQLGHEKGIRFCGQLENIKLKLLDKAGVEESPSVFSDDLSTWHQRLHVVMEVFVDIVKNASESVNQLRALEQLQAAGPLDDKDTLVITRTWSLRQFVAVAEKLLAQYRAELRVKEMVYREICHRTTQSQVTLTSCAWSYPRYVGNETRFIIKCLTVECGLPDVDSPGIKE